MIVMENIILMDMPLLQGPVFPQGLRLSLTHTLSLGRRERYLGRMQVSSPGILWDPFKELCAVETPGI